MHNTIDWILGIIGLVFMFWALVNLSDGFIAKGVWKLIFSVLIIGSLIIQFFFWPMGLPKNELPKLDRYEVLVLHQDSTFVYLKFTDDRDIVRKARVDMCINPESLHQSEDLVTIMVFKDEKNKMFQVIPSQE